MLRAARIADIPTIAQLKLAMFDEAGLAERHWQQRRNGFAHVVVVRELDREGDRRRDESAGECHDEDSANPGQLCVDDVLVGHPRSRSRGARARNALPRWLIASFSSADISAVVRRSPSGTKTGS